jgi:signal peptidase I
MAEEKRPETKNSWKKNVVLYLHDVILYLVMICVVFLLVFRVVVVSGTSMNMTLLDGDYLLLVSNLFYGRPEPGDVIVASKESYDDGAPVVKRVIATEGQTVDIINGVVFVDGVAIDEPYLQPGLATHGGMVQFPLTVDKGCVFVLGDNRINSRDSRYPEIGQIDQREILGRAIVLFFPGTNRDQQDRDFSRIGGLD